MIIKTEKKKKKRSSHCSPKPDGRIKERKACSEIRFIMYKNMPSLFKSMKTRRQTRLSLVKVKMWLNLK